MPANGERKEEKFVNLVRVIFSGPNNSQQPVQNDNGSTSPSLRVKS